MSSVDPTAYDAFGRILSEGGEMGYAIGLARGYPRDRLDAIMLRRFGSDFSVSKDYLRGFADGMLFAAGKANEALAGTGGISMKDIPNNPHLDEEKSGGNLFRWSADVSVEGGENPVTVRGFSNSLDQANMFSEAAQKGRDVAGTNPRAFGLDPDAKVKVTKVEILTFESVIPNGSTSN